MISSRAARFSGSNASISAAPSAANAIALGHGDRSCAAALELHDRRLPCPDDVTVRGGGPQTPDAAPPGVLQGGLVDPIALAVHPVAAGAGESLCSAQETATQFWRHRSVFAPDRAPGWRRPAPGPRRRCNSRARDRARPAGRARMCRDDLSFAAGGRIPGSGVSAVIRVPAAQRARGAPNAHTHRPPPATTSSAPIGGPPRPWSLPPEDR